MNCLENVPLGIANEFKYLGVILFYTNKVDRLKVRKII